MSRELEMGRIHLPKCLCIITTLTFFGLGMSLDSVMLPPKHHARIHRARWIVNLSLACFLVSTGLLCHRLIIFWKMTFGGITDHEAPSDVRNMTDVFLGFCFVFLTLPLWLAIRDGTIECMAKGNCVNRVSLSYLAFMDVVCYTPLFPRLAYDLGHCEAVGYTLPLVLFTLIPIRLVSYFFRDPPSPRNNSCISNIPPLPPTG